MDMDGWKPTDLVHVGYAQMADSDNNSDTALLGRRGG